MAKGNTVGFLRIGTKLETEKFNQEIKDLEIKLAQASEKSDELENNLNDYRESLRYINDEINNLNKNGREQQKIMEIIQALSEQFGSGISEAYESLSQELGSEEAYRQILLSLQENLNGEINKQTLEQRKVNNEIDKTKTKISEVKSKMSGFSRAGVDGFNNLTKGAKRLVIGLIGVQSAYGFLRKIVSTAMASNEHATKQMQANWEALATILEPLITFIIDLMKKVTTAILYFISCLTGIDYIAKANEKALKKQTKATKELAKANDQFTASFDEMNKVQDNSSINDNLPDKIDTTVLFDKNDLPKGLIEFLEKLAEKIKPIYDVIKGFIGWAKDNPEVIIGILGGAAALTFLGKLAGAISDIGTLLGALAIASIIKNVSEIVDAAEKRDKITVETGTKWGKEQFEYAKSREEHNKMIETVGDEREQIDGLADDIFRVIDAERDLNDRFTATVAGMSESDKMWATLNGTMGNYNSVIKNSAGLQFQELENLKKLNDQGKLNTAQQIRYKDALEDFMSKLSGTSEESEILREEFNKFYGSGTAASQAIASIKIETTRLNGQIKAGSDGIKLLQDRLNLFPGIKPKININSDDIEIAIKKFKDLQNVITLLENNKKAYEISMKVFGSVAWGNAIGKIGMATGGVHILNNPGKGVPSGNVIRGEAGSEGVIPLTDESALELLGASIGKFVTVNNTVINKMNARTISKYLEISNSQENFLTNS